MSFPKLLPRPRAHIRRVLERAGDKRFLPAQAVISEAPSFFEARYCRTSSPFMPEFHLPASSPSRFCLVNVCRALVLVVVRHDISSSARRRPRPLLLPVRILRGACKEHTHNPQYARSEMLKHSKPLFSFCFSFSACLTGCPWVHDEPPFPSSCACTDVALRQSWACGAPPHRGGMPREAATTHMF